MNYHVIVIGAGSGGLVVSIGAAKAGKRVLLIDKGTWGGDCTNFGCIPSKTLIAAAQQHKPEPLQLVRNTVRQVRSHEDPEALRKLGIEICEGTAQFVDAHTIEVNGATYKGQHIVIATGSSPVIPAIEGLEGSPYLTNETLFGLTKVPRSLTCLGGGPIGCELAQAFRRLGSDVHLIVRSNQLLRREDPEASALMTDVFKREGIHVHFNAEIENVQSNHQSFTLNLRGNIPEVIQTEHLLICIGHRPNLETLNLPAAGIAHTEQGIYIDNYGRTSQQHIWAIGDCTGRALFTHYAEHMGRTVLRNLLLIGKKKIDPRFPPRCTFTFPEVATLGMIETDARAKHRSIAVYKLPLSDIDRAVCEGFTDGFIKVITKKWSSKILGATIVAPRAGEMLEQLNVAHHFDIPLRKLSSLIHPYPTYSRGVRKVADMWLTQTILKPFKKLQFWNQSKNTSR